MPRRDQARGPGCGSTRRPRRSRGTRRPGGRPGQGRREPADPGRPRRGRRRADAAEAAAAVRRARSRPSAPGSTAEPAPRRRDARASRRGALGLHPARAARAARRRRPGLGPQPDRPLHPRAGSSATGLDPVARGRPRHPDPPAQPRPDRAAADARRGRRLPGRRPARRLRAARRPPARLARTTASAGRGPGSTWPATPTPTATASTPRARSGSTATGSSTPSTATCRSTRSRSSSSPATSCPARRLDQQVATGFHRNTPINQEGGIDLEQFRVESVVDRVNTTATVFLGLTVGCCQCHDHKYDPIAQREYYQLFAFFNNADEPELDDRRARGAGPARRRSEAEIDAFHERLWAERRRAPRARSAPGSRRSTWPARQKQSQEVQDAFDTPFEKRTPRQNRGRLRAFLDQAPDGRRSTAQAARRDAGGHAEARDDDGRPRADRSPARRTSCIEGDFTRPGDPVAPGVPGGPAAARSRRKASPTGSTWPAGWSIRGTR